MQTLKRVLSRISVGWLLLLPIFSISGCGGNSDLASASGTITLDGNPLNNAFVTFIPTSVGTTTYGRTDSNGRYVMQFSNSQSGAWKGWFGRFSTGSDGRADAPESIMRVGQFRTNLPMVASANDKRNSISSFHVGGSQFALADGSVHFLSETVDHNQLAYGAAGTPGTLGTFQKLCARNDGQVNGQW